jgi:hypothetical protein
MREQCHALPSKTRESLVDQDVETALHARRPIKDQRRQLGAAQAQVPVPMHRRLHPIEQASISQLPEPEHVARHPLPGQRMVIAPMSVAMATHPP